MGKIKFSILIPVYNQEDLIIRALDSIPVRDDLEVICVDDCSTDKTWEVLQSYSRIPLKLYRNDKNLKIGTTRNILMDKASGEYLCGLDSDDYLLTDNFNSFLDKFNYDEDIITIRFEDNNGDICNDYGDCCAFWTFFLRKQFIKDNDLKCRDVWRAEDWYFKQAYLKCHPEIVYTKDIIYHYNYPRKGSLTSLWEDGEDE